MPRATGLIDVGRTVIKPDECDERGEFLPRHQFGRYSDGAPLLWNHLGFDRAAMQERAGRLGRGRDAEPLSPAAARRRPRWW